MNALAPLTRMSRVALCTGLDVSMDRGVVGCDESSVGRGELGWLTREYGSGQLELGF